MRPFPSFRIMLLAVPFLLAVAAPAARARTLYDVSYDDPATIVAVADVADVRYLTSGRALVEGGDRLGSALRARGLVVEGVVDADRRETLCVFFPRSRWSDLDPRLAILWEGPYGETLIGCSERDVWLLYEEAASVYPLPARIDVRAWFDNAPPAHVAERPADRDLELRWQVTDVLDAVSIDSLMAHVERLSTYPDGSLRTRHTLRTEECIGEAREYVRDHLTACLPVGSVVDTQRFGVWAYTCDEGPDGPYIEYPADNVVGTLRGTGPGNGYYVVSAHYDATAAGSFKGRGHYWWCDNPAPGADDNGTGVAAALEIARVLTEVGVSFPFDVRFVFFSAEELGLYGSRDYAQAAAARGDTVYGVMNVDMIAYKRSESFPDTCHIMSNAGSNWLADWIVETAEDVYPTEFDDFKAYGVPLGLPLSDHASFWEHGYDAVTALEHWSPRERNPYYHTLEDTMATVSPSQFLATTRMMAGALARLADPSPQTNLAIFEGGIDPLDRLVSGGTARIGLRIYTFGTDETAPVSIELWDGEPDVGDLIGISNDVTTVGGGLVLDRVIEWTLSDADVGDHTLWARVAADGVEEASAADNAVSLETRVDGRSLYVVEHHPGSNPARSMEEIAFCYELSKDGGGVLIEVYDLLGQRLASYDVRGGEATEAGASTVSLSDFDETVDDLASGVYVYRVAVYERGASDASNEVLGKFAVVR